MNLSLLFQKVRGKTRHEFRRLVQGVVNRYPRVFYGGPPKPAHPRIAICYHGPARSLRALVGNHDECIFRPLEKAGIGHQIFVHTWVLTGPQMIWEQPIQAPDDGDAFQLLNLYRFQKDDQSQFLAGLNFNEYFYQDVWDRQGDDVAGEWRPGLLRNYLCSLESQKRVTALVGGDFDFVMYIRPDVEFAAPLDASAIKNLRSQQILLPRFDANAGFNDRFSIMTTETAKLYGSRIDWLPRFRRERGRIVSEKYTRHFILINGLRPRFSDIRFTIVRPSSVP